VLLVARLRVPEDVAVAGFDDIEEGRYSTPTLTSLAPDKRGIAATARLAPPEVPRGPGQPFTLRASAVAGSGNPFIAVAHSDKRPPTRCT
jgi:hypothetical protein